MRVLFIGDVFGQPGRRVLQAHLPTIRNQFDFVIVNMENAAGGFGLHREGAVAALQAGANCMTLGNPAWHHRDVFGMMQDEGRFPIVRPLNYSDPGAPGVGYRTFNVNGERLTVVNLLGGSWMTCWNGMTWAACSLIFTPRPPARKWQWAGTWRAAWLP